MQPVNKTTPRPTGHNSNETLQNILRNALRKKIDITVSNRRGIEAACMLAISELAATEAYLERLLR